MNFSKLQDTLSKAIAGSRLRDAESLADKTYKLSLLDAFFCGEDALKNKKFYEAIGLALADIRVSFPGEKLRVIDAGSGTGILGICALMQGADYVTFIEANPYTLSWSQKFIEKLGYSSRCEFYGEDATEIYLPEKYHLLISETITIDFGREDFHKINAHLQQFLYSHSVIIPEAFELDFSQIILDNTTIQHENISRKSLGGIGSHIELIRPETQVLEISGRAILYSNISICSGESISFFNTKRFDRKDISDTFVWAK